jgi:hypothetical protein
MLARYLIPFDAEAGTHLRLIFFSHSLNNSLFVCIPIITRISRAISTLTKDTGKGDVHGTRLKAGGFAIASPYPL